MIPHIVCTFLLAPLSPSSPEEYALHLIKALNERRQALSSIRCTYNTTTTVSAIVLGRNAGNDPEKTKKLKNHANTTSQSTFVESNDGRFRLDEVENDAAGQPYKQSVFLYDGKTTYSANRRFSKDSAINDWNVFNVRLNDGASLYNDLCLPRKIIGETVLSANEHPFDRVIDVDHVEYVGKQVLNDLACDVFRSPVDLKGSKERIRCSVWMDPMRNWVILQAVTERKVGDSGRGDWVRVRSLNTVEVGKTPIGPPTSSSMMFYFPQKCDIVSYSPDGGELARKVINIESLSLNSPLDSRVFHFDIENGSNIYDVKTKKYWVAGDGPSARLRKIVEARTAEAKRLTQSMQSKPPITVIKRRSTADVVVQIAFFVAFVLATVAIGTWIFRRWRR